jgi:hypothetical protein
MPDDIRDLAEALATEWEYLPSLLEIIPLVGPGRVFRKCGCVSQRSWYVPKNNFLSYSIYSTLFILKVGAQ